MAAHFMMSLTPTAEVRRVMEEMSAAASSASLAPDLFAGACCAAISSLTLCSSRSLLPCLTAAAADLAPLRTCTWSFLGCGRAASRLPSRRLLLCLKPLSSPLPLLPHSDVIMQEPMKVLGRQKTCSTFGAETLGHHPCCLPSCPGQAASRPQLALCCAHTGL